MRKGQNQQCRYRKLFNLFLVAFILWLLPNLAAAQGPPINTESAIITGFDAAALRSFAQVIERSGTMPGGATGELSVVAVPVIIPYQVKENHFVLVLGLPYLHKELTIRQGVTTQELSSSGLGDLKLLALYNLFQRDVGRTTTRMILIGGLKLPTGENNKSGLPPSLQLGTGSVDYTLGSALTYIPSRLGFDADLLYTVNTEANDYRVGNVLKYDLAIGYRLLPVIYETYPAKQLNAYVELNGTYSQRDQLNGQDVADSGGHRIFLSPGIQFILFANFLIEASTQIPIVEELHGRQLKTDYAFNIGFRWLLY